MSSLIRWGSEGEGKKRSLGTSGNQQSLSNEGEDRAEGGNMKIKKDKQDRGSPGLMLKMDVRRRIPAGADSFPGGKC